MGMIAAQSEPIVVFITRSSWEAAAPFRRSTRKPTASSVGPMNTDKSEDKRAADHPEHH